VVVVVDVEGMHLTGFWHHPQQGHAGTHMRRLLTRRLPPEVLHQLDQGPRSLDSSAALATFVRNKVTGDMLRQHPQGGAAPELRQSRREVTEQVGEDDYEVTR